MNFLLPISFDDSNYIQQLSVVARLALQVGISREEFVSLCSSLQSPFHDYAISRYDFLKAEKERNRERNAAAKVHVLQTEVKPPQRAYERLATIPLEVIFASIGKSVNVCGHSIPVKSKRYKCYARKGVKCVKCGIEGKYFAAERQKSQPTDKHHLNLYAVLDAGKEIMMTVDHVIPKSRGGEDTVSNLQPMCSPCNNMKGNRTEEELRVGVSKAAAQAAAASGSGYEKNGDTGRWKFSLDFSHGIR